DPVYIPPGTEPDLEEIQQTMHKGGREVPDHIPIVQEIVPRMSVEYGFRGLYENGRSVLTCQKHQIRGQSYVGGTSVFRETMRDPEIERMSRTLLDHLDWHGLASVQFLRDIESGGYIFTEINPRVWASIEMDVVAGADFPYAHWLVATGNEDRIEPGYTIGAGSHFLLGELRYLRSVFRDHYAHIERPTRRRALWDVLSSCYDQPHFDYIHLDDPGPFVRGVRNQLAIGGRRTGQTAGQ
ncbi:MAG TPA: ATP-grasp domain-containing protein, partial [Halococcus sp.]|nr:ATP-grasp domain-containing protein [Halococcus sp.]